MLKRGGICYCSRGVLVQELLWEWVAIQGGGSGRRWEGNEGWRRLGGDRAQVSLTIHWRDKNHPLSPAWIWADKASHPSRQISRMGEDSLPPGVFIPIIRPNNGTKTCWGSLWCQAQLWSWIHLMSPQKILTAWCSNKALHLPGEGLVGSLTPSPSLQSVLASALTAHASMESRNCLTTWLWLPHPWV